MKLFQKAENICAIGLIVFFFFPWLQMFGFGLSGFGLAQLSSYAGLAWLIPVFSAITIGAGLAGKSQRAVGLITGALPITYLLYGLNEMGADIFHTLGIGAYLTLIAGIVLILSSLGAIRIPQTTMQAVRDVIQLGNQSREQTSTYSEELDFTQSVKEITKHILPNEWFALLGQATGRDALSRLCAACQDQLEESPKHPGLLLLRGFCELDLNNEGLQYIGEACLALQQAHPDVDSLRIARRFVKAVRQSFPSQVDSVLQTLLEHYSSVEFTRLCYAETSPYSPVYARALFALADNICDTLQKGGPENERFPR